MQSITYKTINVSIQLFKYNFNFVHFEERFGLQLLTCMP